MLTESALPFPTGCVKHLRAQRRGFEPNDGWKTGDCLSRCGGQESEPPAMT